MSDTELDPLEQLVAEFREPPDPPAILYKYLAPERIDVLQHARIRYTQLNGTNDEFEIRRTFATMLGPKMQGIIRHQLQSVNIEEMIINTVSEHTGMSLDDARRWYDENKDDPKVSQVVSNAPSLLENFLGDMARASSTPEAVMHVLDQFASQTAALSLSDDPYVSQMWTHYAANWSGFVIAFKTDDASLTPSKENGSMFIPIQYRQDMQEELFDDPIGALFSKQPGWSYEREWRKIIRPDQADFTIAAQPDDIFLKNFSRNAVDRVIVGHRASDNLVASIRAELQGYPGARLFQTRSNKADGSVAEVELSL